METVVLLVGWHWQIIVFDTRDRWIMRLCARIILRIIGQILHNPTSSAHFRIISLIYEWRFVIHQEFCLVTNVRTLYILTTNTVSVFPAKFIKYSLLLAYFSYLLIVGNSLLTSLFTCWQSISISVLDWLKFELKKVRIIGKKCAHNL